MIEHSKNYTHSTNNVSDKGDCEMADREVRIMLPVDGRIVTVELEDTMTSDEIINELLANDVIQRSPAGYKLAIKGGAELNATTQLKNADLNPNTVIQVIPATDAGFT